MAAAQATRRNLRIGKGSNRPGPASVLRPANGGPIRLRRNRHSALRFTRWERLVERHLVCHLAPNSWAGFRVRAECGADGFQAISCAVGIGRRGYHFREKVATLARRKPSKE